MMISAYISFKYLDSFSHIRSLESVMELFYLFIFNLIRTLGHLKHYLENRFENLINAVPSSSKEMGHSAPMRPRAYEGVGGKEWIGIEPSTNVCWVGWGLGLGEVVWEWGGCWGAWLRSPCEGAQKKPPAYSTSGGGTFPLWQGPWPTVLHIVTCHHLDVRHGQRGKSNTFLLLKELTQSVPASITLKLLLAWMDKCDWSDCS